MCTFDDFHGVYFTVQALRLYHGVMKTGYSEIVVVDNNPESEHGEATKNFMGRIPNGRYIPYTKKRGTSVKNEVFREASGKITLCLDCHVLLVPHSIDTLIKYFSNVNNQRNLVNGPLLYDELKVEHTHWKPLFSGDMYGTWDVDSRVHTGIPFEIPMQGMGCFASMTEHWLGFPDEFRGFGSEEGYIHEKYRLNGAKAVCLPQLKWVHRFARPEGVKYEINYEDRVFNYLFGWYELYQDLNHPFIKGCLKHFRDKVNDIDSLLNEAITTYERRK